MGGGPVPNLKKLDPEDRVESVGYCRDTYEVATADGKNGSSGNAAQDGPQ